MAINIVLYQPEIPPNTGNIARSCAITGSKLHLIKPLGFSIDDKQLKRAGLDYWAYLDLEVHESEDAFLKSMVMKNYISRRRKRQNIMMSFHLKMSALSYLVERPLDYLHTFMNAILTRGLKSQ